MKSDYLNDWSRCSDVFACRKRSSAQENSFPVSIQVDAASSKGELNRIWRYFGADEPNYAYMKDGRKLLGQLGELAPKEVYFRTHNLMTTGPGAPGVEWARLSLQVESSIPNWKPPRD